MLSPYHQFLYYKYRNFTMIPQSVFVGNLHLVRRYAPEAGAIVECGVWRGGMSAATAEILGREREYFLFDSFDGLPKAQEIDGPDALAWQKDTRSPTYFDNCKAEFEQARRAMTMSGALKFQIIKGWFSETLPTYPRTKGIAVLRLDGDWYDSTMECLDNLFSLVVDGGLVIIDDYYAWDGCARAVHDFLARTASTSRLRQSGAGVCFIIKTPDRKID